MDRATRKEREMTKEYIKSKAFETVVEMVGNPFGYAADSTAESDAMAPVTLGVVYGIMMLSDSLCIEMDKTQKDADELMQTDK